MKHSVARFTSRISILVAFCLAATALIATFSSAASRTGLPREVLAAPANGGVPANNPAAPEGLSTTHGTRGEIPEGKAGARESLSGPTQLSSGSDLMLLRSANAVVPTPPLPPVATLDVDTIVDDATKTACTAAANDCSLRGAVIKANTMSANTGTGTIQINVPATLGTYTLSVSPFEIVAGSATNLNTTITGTSGTAKIVAAANNRIFDTPFPQGALQLTFQNLELTGGHPGGTFGGAAILAGGNNGSVTTITNCNIHDNSSVAGPGAVESTAGGSLIVSGSTFTNNKVTGTNNTNGGAIDFRNQATGNSGSLTITTSTFTGNQANNVLGGGAVRSSTRSGTSTISDCTFTGNSATNAAGIGGAVVNSLGNLSINLCRVTGNTAAGGGKGVAQQTGSVGSINATNNWWGCDGFPGSAGCDTTLPTISSGVPPSTGQIAYDPRVDLVVSAGSISVCSNGSTTLTADFSKNSNGVAINPIVLNGLTVSFALVGGPAGSSVSPSSATISGFMAGSNFNAGSASGGATVSATLDNGTQTASITVNQSPTVSTNPTDQTVCDGATATFTATANGNPTPTVQWQVSTNGGGLFSDISGATNPILTFTASTSQSGNQYRAVFTNTCGTATTSAATLTVNTAPTVSTNPSNQTVCEGATASFTAAAGGSASTVQWQVSTNGGGSFSNISGATSATLSFTASAAQSGNQYRAVFTNSCDTATTTAATLTVNTGPAVTTNPGNQTLCEGGTASFTAAASGSASTVQWQVSTNGGGSFSDIAGATSTTLSFTTAASQSGNQYRAVFTNECSTATTSAATLTVNTTPVVTTNPVSQTVNSGNVTFTAAASGSPTPTVQWQVSTNGGGLFSDIPGATSTSLTFATDPSQNGNQYRAVFTNVCGTATTTAATLTTCTPPAVTGNPSSVADACVGQVVSFTASASGSPTPTVQWQVSTNGGASFSDISGATSTTLIVTASVSVRNNQYRAVFTNACGTATTSAATLGVDTIAPIITLNGQTIELWPPNHQYHTVNLTDLVASATDNCNGNLLSSVVIASVSSDEPEEDPNGGDGNTLNDIVIAPDCKSVQLRAERDGNLNGRVYTITFKVTDSAGNVGTVTAKVSVPHSQNGVPAVDDGPGAGYTVTSSCP